MPRSAQAYHRRWGDPQPSICADRIDHDAELVGQILGPGRGIARAGRHLREHARDGQDGGIASLEDEAPRIDVCPESTTTQGGTKITKFSLATSRPKRDSNGKVLKDDNNRRLEDTEWHRITCFNGVGTTVEQYVDKGMKVMVRGRIHYTRWTDTENVERYGVEIIAEDVTFLTRAKAAKSQPGSNDTTDDDDIPF